MYIRTWHHTCADVLYNNALKCYFDEHLNFKCSPLKSVISSCFISVNSEIVVDSNQSFNVMTNAGSTEPLCPQSACTCLQE